MTDAQTKEYAKEFAIEIFERHFRAEKFLIDDESAKNAAIVTIDCMIDMLVYHGCDIGKYSLLLLTETRQHLNFL